MKKFFSKWRRPTTEDISLHDVEFLADQNADDTLRTGAVTKDLSLDEVEPVSRSEASAKAPTTEDILIEEIEFVTEKSGTDESPHSEPSSETAMPKPEVALPKPEVAVPTPEVVAPPSEAVTPRATDATSDIVDGASSDELDQVSTGPPLEADELYALAGNRSLIIFVALGLGAVVVLLIVISMVCVLRPDEQVTEIAGIDQDDTSSLIGGPEPPPALSESAAASVDAASDVGHLEEEVREADVAAEPESDGGAASDDGDAQPTEEAAASRGGEPSGADEAMASTGGGSPATTTRQQGGGTSSAPADRGSPEKASSSNVQRDDSEPDPVRAALRRVSSSIRGCFRRRERTGTVMVSYRISADGAISYVGATPSVSFGTERCIRDTVGQTRVNPAPGSDRAVRHPVVFLRVP